MMSMDFVEQQQVSETYNFWGGYAQGGYFATDKLQPMVRFDVMDRNSTKTNGLLMMPAVGANYYFSGYNLKLQAMYQKTMKVGHASQFEADDDDNGLPEHMAVVQLQFAF